MPNQEYIFDIIQRNDIVALQSLSAKALFTYHDNIYKNVILHAVRHCSVEMVTAMVEKLNAVDARALKRLLNEEDYLGRSALALASVADNAKLICYLHQTLRFKLNYRDQDSNSALCFAIQRDAHGAFQQLLLEGAEFTEYEVKVLVQNKAFQTYFNSPACFLLIVKSGNVSALKIILRYIKTQPPEVQKPFLHATHEGRHALLLAAYLDCDDRFIQLLLTLPFDLTTQDEQQRRVLYYLGKYGKIESVLTILSKLEKILPEEAALIREKQDAFPLETIAQRNRLARALSDSCGVDQAGRTARIAAKGDQLRPYRPFKQERERQLLRQISTQLYFYFSEVLSDKALSGNLVEVQSMHLEIDGKHFLFVAANEASVTKHFPMLIEKTDEFARALVKTYCPARDLEGQRRSARYAAKLATRVFDLDTQLPGDAEKQVRNLALLLRERRVSHLTLKSDSQADTETVKAAIQNSEGGIFFVRVDYCSNDRQHAEEFLVNIAKYAARLGAVYTCIAGKKRPCIGCFGRMDAAGVSQFSPRPGRLWVHTMEHQSPAVARRTLSTLFQHASHVSLAEDGKTMTRDYDTGSDSEGEDGREFPQLLDMEFKKRRLIQREPFAELLEEGSVTIEELARCSNEELSLLAEYDIRTAISERGLSIQALLALYAEDPMHLRCVTCGDLADLVLEYAPDVNAILMRYAEAEDVDLAWVTSQLCDSDAALFQIRLQNIGRNEADFDEAPDADDDIAPPGLYLGA